jgi:hypothetical protein
LSARLERATPHLLRADLPPAPPQDARRRLELLTSPARDLASLVLAPATADPLGAEQRVRAWTLAEPYPDGELARVAATLDHIVRTVGRELPGGADVAVTPDMGADVFPFQYCPPRAVGVFYHHDGYCAARADLPREVRAEVVEHELVHAYCYGRGPGFSSSRFVTEGLAEYLRLVEPGDHGLDVPSARLADSFVELDLALTRLARRGVDMRTLRLDRLVGLGPAEFYALGHVGYLIAQATIARVGGELVREALVEGSDRLLVDAIRALAWRDVLALVVAHAGEGRPGRAVVVDDEIVDDGAAPPAEAPALDAVLETIGATTDPARKEAPDARALRVEPVAAHKEDVASALRLLLDAPGPVRILADVSPAMDREVRVADAPPSLSEAVTPRRFAAELAAMLDAAGRRTPQVVTLARDRVTGGLGLLEAVAPFDLNPAERVVAFGSGTGERRLLALPSLAETPAVYVVGSPGIGELTLAGTESGVVLVIDLSPDGQGVALARTYRCAYWRPVAE